MIDSAVTLLPQPDSPTTPSVVRGAISNDTPSTARTQPSSVRNSVTRSRISSSVVGSGAGTAIRASLPAPRATTNSGGRSGWIPVRRTVGVQLRDVQPGHVQRGVEPAKDAARRGDETRRAIALHERGVDRRAAQHPARELVDDGLAGPRDALATAGGGARRGRDRRLRPPCGLG